MKIAMKKMNQWRKFLALPVMMFGITAMAQQTGSFHENIDFMGAQRRLSFYVPPTYDASVSYKLMIGLHGLGDGSNNYRNALVNSLGFAAAMPNTILVCPDGGSDQMRDFYTPAGDEAIIAESIAYAREHYNIDTTQIILQGFSLGANSALRYGLQHTDQFKGLVLNTPAVQGVKQAVTQFDDGGIFDYAQASEIPIYITHGEEDEVYGAPIDSLVEQLVRHDALHVLKRFNGGHSVPAFANHDYNAFFDAPLHNGPDLSVSRVIVQPRSCNPITEARVLIQNTGNEPLTAIEMTYSVNAAPVTFNWTGNLLPGQHTEAELPAFSSDEGNYTLEVNAGLLNGANSDVVVTNNTAVAAFRIAGVAMELPIVERFENEQYNNTWLTEPSGDFIMPWSFDDEFKALTCLNTIFIFDNAGRKEEISSPLLDLTSFPNPKLGFDVAYTYTEFTAAFLGIDAVFADTLEVLISTDCGENFERLFKKGGSELLTFQAPLVNPSGIQSYFVSPGTSDWRREIIDLSPFASSQQAIVKFRYISALGGVIFLDNISFNDGKVGIKNLAKTTFQMYPNPATDQLFLSVGSGKIESVSLMDMTGREVYRHAEVGQSQVTLNLSSVPVGVYIVQAQTTAGPLSRKVVVQR
jgi:predicted esterase